MEDIIKQAQDMLPALRAEYAQAALELREEEADVAELQNSDKDYLDELKVSIAEQESVLMHAGTSRTLIFSCYVALNCKLSKPVSPRRRRS